MRAAAQQALEALEFANEQAVCAHHDDQAHVYRAAIEALRTALAQPEGWQLVPKEPTQEMTEAGATSINYNGGNARWSDVREAWADMLAAALSYSELTPV